MDKSDVVQYISSSRNSVPSSYVIDTYCERTENKMNSYQSIESFSTDYTKYTTPKAVYDYVEGRIDTVLNDYTELAELVGADEE
jgi:hypothetical protein